MSEDSCPLPPRGEGERAVIKRLLGALRIAVVGLSDDPSRPSHGVAEYLIRAGKQVIPVNPNHETVLGLTCYARLEDVDGPIDLVDVFRRPQYCAAMVESAIRLGAKGVWLQSGIRSPEARHLALEAGLDYIEDRCLMVELMYRDRL
jgi:predicted CoA-binding protein